MNQIAELNEVERFGAKLSQEAVSMLTYREQAVFTMRYREGRSLKYIADFLDISIEKARSLELRMENHVIKIRNHTYCPRHGSKRAKRVYQERQLFSVKTKIAIASHISMSLAWRSLVLYVEEFYQFYCEKGLQSLPIENLQRIVGCPHKNQYAIRRILARSNSTEYIVLGDLLDLALRLDGTLYIPHLTANGTSKVFNLICGIADECKKSVTVTLR
jgi:hypothetical protein